MKNTEKIMFILMILFIVVISYYIIHHKSKEGYQQYI